MSRTIRKTRRGLTVRDGQAFRCVEPDCDYCSDSRTYARRLAATVAAEKVVEAIVPAQDEPEVEYPHVGFDSACECFECRQVWEDLAAQALCPACGGVECRL